MAVDRFEVRVSITKLLLALVIVIVPLSIIGLVLTERSDRILDNSVGSDFKAMAQMLSNDVSQTITDRVAAVRALASDPTIAAAVSGSHKPTGQNGLLTSSVSQLLKERRTLDPRYLSIILTDSSGNVTAASQQPGQMSYAQDAVWQGVFNNGQGAVKISDIVDDEFTKSYYINIGAPVVDTATGTTNGVLSAAVNISDLLARFRQESIGRGAHAALVNEDGLVVSGPNADVFARVRSQEFDFVKDSMGSTQGNQAGWTTAHLPNGPYLVGYAATGLQKHFPNLNWVVTVSQDEHEAAAPVRQLQRFALWMVILGILMLTLLFVYYYLHRAQRYTRLEDEEDVSNRSRTASASA
ncbi:MAG: cache domain-containing protein [Acidobacteriaceae bacterium]|nr:cache domain-containing protein [Acidobacteriaceae bacterium]